MDEVSERYGQQEAVEARNIAATHNIKPSKKRRGQQASSSDPANRSGAYRSETCLGQKGGNDDSRGSKPVRRAASRRKLDPRVVGEPGLNWRG